MKEDTTVTVASRSGPQEFPLAHDTTEAALLLAPCDEPPLVAGRRGLGEMLLDLAVAADDMTS